MTKTTLLAAAAAATLAAAAQAEVVAFDRFGGDDLNLTSFTGEASYSSPGDGFNEYDSGESAPFALIDSSAGTFTTDSLGIVVDDATGAYDPFFGATDTVNDDNSSGDEQAIWTFDISSVVSGLSVSVDLGAMGDFESSDLYNISVQVDGGPIVPVFTGSVDEDGSQDYTLADGDTFTLDDPFLINGTALSNVYTTFSAPVAGTGSTLSVILDATLNGGSEAIALDNLVIEGVVPEPATAGLLGLAGLAVLRRRRA